MNIQEYDCQAGFNVFAVDYFSKNTDVRTSLNISILNKSTYEEFNEYSAPIWAEIKKIYSLENEEASTENLKNRMVTDYANIFSLPKFQNSKVADFIDYVYMKPKSLGFLQIQVVHAIARLIYERSFWTNINSQLVSLKKVTGNYDEIYKKFPNSDLAGYANLLKSFEVNLMCAAEARLKKDLNDDYTLKIDEWIKNNKENFPLITVLNLSAGKVNYSCLTSEISHFTGLTKIHLKGFNLKNLPTEIGNLKKLNYIDLRENSFLEFPAILTELIGLEAINLSYNKITIIPGTIKNLINLKKLTLNNNSISSVSESLCLLKLTTLNLERNPITRGNLPANICAKKISIAEHLIQQQKEQLNLTSTQEKLVKKIRKVQKEEFEIERLVSYSNEDARVFLIKQKQNQNFLQSGFRTPFTNPAQAQLEQSQIQQIEKLLQDYTQLKSYHANMILNIQQRMKQPVRQQQHEQLIRLCQQQHERRMLLLKQIMDLQFQHMHTNMKQMFQQPKPLVEIIEQEIESDGEEDSLSIEEDVKEPLDAVQNNKRNNSFDEYEDESDLKKHRKK